MTDILLDSNVILDYLLERHEYAVAAQIVSLQEAKQIICHISAHEVTTIAYILEKHKVPAVTRQDIMHWLLTTFIVAPTDGSVLAAALRSQITDFEDGIIEAAAASNNCSYIITQNVRDFAKSSVPALTPTEFIATII